MVATWEVATAISNGLLDLLSSVTCEQGRLYGGLEKVAEAILMVVGLDT